MKKKKILFVCLGNICRSPIAHGVAQKIVKTQNLNFEIDSAGLSGYHEGEPPCKNSQIIAKNFNIDISKQQSRPVTNEDVENYDYILGMDGSNISSLKLRGVKKPIKLGDFGLYGKDIPDPYLYRGFEGFEKIYEMIDICVKNFLDKIK